MNGILSAHPGQGAIRLLVGSHGLLLVQSAFTAWGGVEDGSRILTIVALGIAVPAFVCALIGDGADHDRPWRHRDAR